MAALTTVSIILQMIPAILEIIKSVEEQIPQSGKGNEKREYIKNVLTTVYPQVIEIWALVEKIINASVTLYNATGVFKK
jgi:hypothetical protein